jgi:uncharacterized protein YceK
MMLRFLVLVACCGTIGCATVATLTFTSRIEEEMYNNPKELQYLPRVYSGTIADAYCVSRFAEPILLCLIDLPLSIAGDTIVLPYTIVRQVKSGGLRPRCGERMRDSVAGRRQREYTEARESCARLLSDSAAPIATQTTCRKILAGPASAPPPRSEQEACGDAPFDPFDSP